MALDVQGDFLVGRNLTVNGLATASTQTAGDNSTTLATTAFVNTAISAGGSSTMLNGSHGFFDTGINNVVVGTPSSSGTTLFTAPSTSTVRYIVHSVQVSNTTLGSMNFTASQVISGGSTVYWAYNLPIPGTSAVEILKRPKVMNPNDLLNAISSTSGALSVTVTYSTITTTSLVGSGINATRTMASLVTAGGNGAVFDSILVVNSGSVTDGVSVIITDGSNNVQSYLSYLLPIPVGSTIELLESPKMLTNGWKLQATSSNSSSSIVAASRNR